MQYYLKNVDETLSEVKSGIRRIDIRSRQAKGLPATEKTSWQRPRKIHC